MTRLLLAACLVAMVALPTSASADTPDLLSRLVAAQRTVAYRGEQVIATWNGAQAQATLVAVEHDPPGWTRLEYAPIGSASRRVVLRRERTEIEYDPATRTGTRRSRIETADEDVESTHLTWLRANYHLTITPATVLGRPAVGIVLRPRTPDRPARRLYMDEATGVVLRSEHIAPDGRLGEASTFVTFVPMPRRWRFDSSPPTGVHFSAEVTPRPVTAQTAARIAGRDLVPFTPPDGFHTLGRYLVGEEPPVLQTIYSDGLSTLVLTQRRGTVLHAPRPSRMVETGGGSVWIHAMGLRTLAHWASDGWLLTLVGDVSAEAMVTAARRTGVSPHPRLLDRLVAWLSHLRRSLAPES